VVSCIGKLTSRWFHEVLIEIHIYRDLRVIIKSLCRSELDRTDLCWIILGLNWSTCFFFFVSSPCIAAPPLSHIYLSTTNVEHLVSITFSNMLKLISARREFTFCCSFLVRLRVIGPWFIFIGVLRSSTCVIVRSVGMSTSSSLSWKRSHPRLWLLWAWSCDDHCCSRI
jgi:hypothetical protein